MGDTRDHSEPESDPQSWDAADPRRRHDPMAPPTEPCECYCLHCGRVFMSDQMWLQRIVGARDSTLDGFWMCPTPNCSGAGFTFDIFPTDPTHPANAGWYEDDDDYEDYEEFNDLEETAADWDPDESKYKQLDAAFGNDDDDIEGEEWKYGLTPGEQLPEPDWHQQARRQREEEERRYNEPDQRPRELDWTNRDERETGLTEDDIPF
ncbi:MAG TPA: hypothetical protein VHD56_15730 [Tepidisphaeraceae bacterium]|nr:hypothetical protein [Tepidisphaeraceae bacterium]